jgi:hypothetical protein
MNDSCNYHLFHFPLTERLFNYIIEVRLYCPKGFSGAATGEACPTGER